MKKTIIIILFSGTFILSAGFVSNYFEISKNLDIFATLFKQLHLHYVDEINSSSLIKTAIDEMLESLDPYTNFIPEDEIEDFRFMTTGQYGGIGALIQNRDDHIMISDPYYNYPAFKAGLRASDVIIEVNGRSIKGVNSLDVRNLLRGQAGTPITLTIKRYGKEEPFEVEVIREDVKIDNIPYYNVIDGDIGYLKLSGFTENAGRETKEAFLELKKEHGIKSFILDLRGNGGGLLNEAVNVANIFLERGLLIVNTKGKIEERNTRHQTLSPPVDKEIPIVVLIDRASASASEIVAGAIQDYDRGVVIGQRSFGKGLVQNVVPLSYNSRLKVTVAKYYIPSGRCIQAINYAERNEDGSVSLIPDSLKVPFETRGGRVVYDGGGIEPDVFVEPYRYSQISASLIGKYHIFDFATKYFYQNKSIPPVSSFDITDDIYQKFLGFIADKDYDYETLSERKMKELKETAQREKYFERIEEEYELFSKSLMHNKEDDLITFKEEIKFLLRNEIVSRYYYQKGRIESNLSFDNDIKKAKEVLKNNDLYTSILNGTYKQD